MKNLSLSALVLIASIVLPLSSKASGIGEVNLSYGGYTIMDAGSYKAGFYGVKTAWGAVNASLYINLDNVIPNLSVGPSYTFSSAKTGAGYYDSNFYYNAILLNAKYQYYSNSIVKLYGHVGIGAEITHVSPAYMENFNKTYFGFQVSPIGAMVDLPYNLGIYAEAGFGCQGLVQVGVKYSF